jgi:hypothetical protein
VVVAPAGPSLQSGAFEGIARHYGEPSDVEIHLVLVGDQPQIQIEGSTIASLIVLPNTAFANELLPQIVAFADHVVLVDYDPGEALFEALDKNSIRQPAFASTAASAASRDTRTLIAAAIARRAESRISRFIVGTGAMARMLKNWGVPAEKIFVTTAGEPAAAVRSFGVTERLNRRAGPAA